MSRLEDRWAMLEKLPERMEAVELQILQLRGDVSVLRTEMRELHAEALHHADDLNAQTIQVVETLHAGTNQRIDELNAETRRHMQVLHEETLDRIKRLGESQHGG